jgi:hypothetical protein
MTKNNSFNSILSLLLRMLKAFVGLKIFAFFAFLSVISINNAYFSSPVNLQYRECYGVSTTASCICLRMSSVVNLIPLSLPGFKIS